MSGGPLRSGPETPCHAFVGGLVLTMAPSAGAVEAVVTLGDRIAAVGRRELVEGFPGAEVHDLAGRTLCPGFIDAHHHLSIAALHPRWADLRSVTTLEELAAALVAQARLHPDDPWIRAAGWTELGSGLVPSRHDLDALGLDRPVLVAHYSLHQAVTDSRGLEELGIGEAVPDPPGGAIGRDPRGRPDGLLVERAWSEAHSRSLAPYDDPDRWADHIETAARALVRDGITAVHDTACPPEAEAAYRQLAASKRLPISVLACPHPRRLLGPVDDRRLREGPPTGEGDEWLRTGPAKIFADGGVAPAIDVHLHGRRLAIGMVFDDVAGQVEAATSTGYRVAVHAIGNAGLDVALAAFEETAARHPGADHRFRVEHACLASPAQLGRLASLGAVAVVQPAFLAHLGRQVEGVVFDDAGWLAFGAMQAAGVAMAASSDCPCTFHEPLAGARHGADRRTGSGAVLDQGQAVAFVDWLRAYTAGAAHAGGQEAERGAIAVGRRADLVVLDGAPTADPLPAVAQTWVAGRLVFDAGRSEGAVTAGPLA